MGLTTAGGPGGQGSEQEPLVLVIDPNPEHQTLSSMALGRKGFRVTIAGTAREGLRLALSQTFAAIVLDLKVKDLPALDVLHVLRERVPDTPKILVVAVGQEQSAVRALASGAAGYLVKTARYNELLPSEVAAQIQTAEARRTLKEQTKALGESEERFQKAFRASPIALAILTRREGRFVDANDAFLNILGVRRDELIGRTGDEAQVRVDAAASERILAELRRSGSVREAELPFVSRSGEPRIGVSSIEIIEIEGQACILTILRDVTDSIRGERLRAALHAISEAAASAHDLAELFPVIQRSVASLMSASNFYIALHDAATDLIDFRYFVDEKEPRPPPYKAGQGLTELVLRSGEPLLVTPDVVERLVTDGKIAAVGAEGIDWLGVPLAVGGKTFGVLAVQSYADTARYTEDDKQVLSVVSAQAALAIDRKRAEEALRQAEARFRTVFESAPVGVSLAEMDGHIRETNPALQRMLGRASDEIRGMHLLGITTPDDVGQTLRFLQDIAKGGGSSIRYETRLLRKDGTPFWARITGALMKAPPPEPALIVTLIEDVTEAKEALEARERDSRRFERLIAKIDDGISLIGPDGIVTWQSPSAIRIFGYTPEQAIGRSGLEYLHPDDLEQIGPGFADLMATPGKTVVAEVRIRHKDGSWRWAEVAGTNLLHDPDLHAVVFNYRDITQRTEALEQIRFQASLLSHVRNAVVATDAGLRVVYWNDYATHLFGWKSGEVQNVYIGEFLRSPEAQTDFEAIARTIQERGHWEGERMVANKDGVRFATSVTVTSLQDRHGEPIGYVAVISDITERVKAEKALEARAHQQSAIAALGQRALVEPSMFAFLTEALRALTGTLSVEYASILELAADRASFELQAKHGWDIPLGTRMPNHPDESLAGFAMAANAPAILENAATDTRFKVPAMFRERGLVSGISVPIPGQTGPYGILSADSRSPRAFSKDDVDFVSSVATVIANAIERHRIEKVLAENERLASMGQLASYVAHEINTPLTNISLLASNIARREKDPTILRKLDEIGEQRRKATAIITDLVNVPRQPVFRRVPEDLRAVVAAAVEHVAPYRKRDVALIVEPRDRALFANINALQIRDVLVNLLTNALQATSHGNVTVRLSELPEYVFVSVEDTGTGMPPEVLQQLFHPLYGAGAQGEGPLLGLALSRNIVAAHGGKIEATSEVGRGSTFTVILPRFDAH